MKSPFYHPLLLCAFIVFLAIIALLNYQQNEKSSMTFAEVESLSIDKNYPKNPYALVSIYNKILLVLYSGNLTEEESQETLRLQRGLFAKELLALNSYDAQYAELETELASFEESGNFIEEITIENMNYDTVDENICQLQTKQYITNGQVILFDYCLITEDGEWKILSWESVE